MDCDDFPFLMIEPSAVHKRRFSAQVLNDPADTRTVDEAGLRQRLQKMRVSSLEKLETSLQNVSCLFKKGGSPALIYAASAYDACNIIKRACGNTQSICINKSAVITRELKTCLAAAGLNIIESYYTDLHHKNEEFTHYWQLPRIPITSIFNAFEGEPLKSPGARDGMKKRRDIVGVIGVSAISADDGSVVLIQHRQNIKKIIEECRSVFLVAGIDKVVPTKEEALFQAKCMACFGMTALLMDSGAGSEESASMEDYPLEIPYDKSKCRLSLILMDNGRREIMQSDFLPLMTCIGCRACMNQCPGSRFFDTSSALSPRELLFLQLTEGNMALDLCLQCNVCRTVCPVNIDLPGMILKLRILQKKYHVLNYFRDFLLSKMEEIEKTGSYFAPVANLFSRNKAVKKLAELFTGISCRRDIPFFRAPTFEKIFKDQVSGHGK